MEDLMSASKKIKNSLLTNSIYFKTTNPISFSLSDFVFLFSSGNYKNIPPATSIR